MVTSLQLGLLGLELGGALLGLLGPLLLVVDLALLGRPQGEQGGGKAGHAEEGEGRLLALLARRRRPRRAAA